MNNEQLTWHYMQLSHGREAVLNNLITANLNSITATPQWTAFCNVQGKVITTAWIWREETAWAVACHTTMQQPLLTHIQHYALRDRFTVIEHSEYVHPIYKTALAMIEHNLPVIDTQSSEKFLPQMLKLDTHIGAIDWQKGCYLGQEIIMRTKQLGRVKRHLCRAIMDEPPETTTLIDLNKQPCGQIINQTTEGPYQLSCVINHQVTEVYCAGKPVKLLT